MRKNLLGSILNLKSSWNTSASSRWLPPSSVNSVDLLQASSSTLRDKLQPSDSTKPLVCLANDRIRGSAHTRVLGAGGNTEFLCSGVEIKDWYSSSVKVVVAGDNEVGRGKRFLPGGFELELERDAGEDSKEVGEGGGDTGCVVEGCYCADGDGDGGCVCGIAGVVLDSTTDRDMF